jgi:hypothetical protein
MELFTGHIQMILPPFVSARLREKYNQDPDKYVIPAREIARISDRIRDDKAYRELVWETAHELKKFIAEPGPDWGPWPSDLDSQIAIAINLGLLLKQDCDAAICDFEPDVLAYLEAGCMENGVDLENYMINMILIAKKDKAPSDADDSADWWKLN